MKQPNLKWTENGNQYILEVTRDGELIGKATIDRFDINGMTKLMAYEGTWPFYGHSQHSKTPDAEKKFAESILKRRLKI